MNERHQETRGHIVQWIGPLLFVASFAVYCVTLSPGAFPGPSARLIVQHSGLDPFPPMSHPLWGVLVWLAGKIPLGTLAIRLNLLSALCCSGSVALLYALVSRIRRNRTYEELDVSFSAGFVRSLSGVVAALILAFCIPFWQLATRAYPLSFDLFLLLLAVYCLVRISEGERGTGSICAFALLWGLGTTEFATFITWSPVVLIALLFVMWRKGLLRAGPVAGALGCWLLGLSVYLLFTVKYRMSPAAEWRGFYTHFQVLWFIWREQYRAIAKSVPQVGWLLVFLVTVLPWLVIIALPKRAPNRGARLGSLILYTVFSAVALAVMFNARIAPWPLLGWGPIVVTPYALVAMWAGYLAGYWYVLLQHRSRLERRAIVSVRHALRRAYLPVLAIILACAMVRNFPVANGRQSRQIIRLAEHVVDALDGRPWLVTYSPLDDSIVIAAAERGLPLRTLDLSSGGETAYLDYVASHFEDPRLKGLVHIGLAPALNEWLLTEPDIENQVAMLSNPDPWLANGFAVLPHLTLFRGVKDPGSIDCDALMGEHRAFWDSCGVDLRENIKPGTLTEPWHRWALGHLSKVANNLGVFFEDMQRDDLALEAYQEARVLDTNNVSSLLNMVSLTARTSHPEAKAVDAELQAFLGQLRSKLNTWSLAYHYGYVRHPEAFASRGWTWALSGKANRAIADMERALALGARSHPLQMALAALYFGEEMDEQSEKKFLALLDANPDHGPAVLGLARLAMRKGDYDVARTYLGRLEALGMPSGLLRLEQIAMESMMGNVSRARAMLEELLEEQPENHKALASLAILAARDGDDEVVARCVSKIEMAGAEGLPGIRLALATISVSENHLEAARIHLEALLRARPNDREAWEALIDVDLRERRRALAEEHVAKLLLLDPQNAMGNLVLGGLQLLREEYALAEASFRASLRSERSPRALNELAWVLQKRGAYEEAFPLVREALEGEPRSGIAWDTLGSVLLGLDRIDEAEEALQTALEIRPDNPSVILHMAQVYERKGMGQEALKLADSLLARSAEMSMDSYKETRDLARRIRSGR